MVLEYDFLGRDKLAKGQTYPIKRGDLDEALEKAGVTEIKYVAYTCYVDKKEDVCVLSAHMHGESRHPGYSTHQSPDIGVNSIPVDISPKIKKLLAKNDILNRLAKWLKRLEEAESVRRDRSQHFKVFYRDESLVVDATE